MWVGHRCGGWVAGGTYGLVRSVVASLGSRICEWRCGLCQSEDQRFKPFYCFRYTSPLDLIPWRWLLTNSNQAVRGVLNTHHISLAVLFLIFAASSAYLVTLKSYDGPSEIWTNLCFNSRCMHEPVISSLRHNDDSFSVHRWYNHSF